MPHPRSIRAAGRLAAFALVLALAGCGRPAQIGADRDTFRAVDALYTAIGMRDPSLVDRCSDQIRDLRARDRIPTAAAAALTSFIAEARAGGWESAQLKLATFMEGQRR